MTAAAFIGSTATMVAPYRIAQIQCAWIGGRADHRTANRTGGSPKRRITRSRANRGAACGAQQGATARPVTRIGAAARDEQRRGKTHHHCRAHVWLPYLLALET